ncbi:pyridoxamine kinase [Bengtsoniella intestinalis]|uniref:pyridoxamine kinase n=1 Tax=Bengtsoniella intestinalis TaxID=3073143 RepID=UPI00391F36C6
MTDSPTPKVAAIHDLSGYGRCSLTVAMPILSVMAIQCCPVATASLSTHTGAGFEGFSFLDMTSELGKITRHWASLELYFDAIYSGFLGSEQQIVLVSEMIDTFQSPLVVIDPVMGDHGQVYKTYTPAMCEGMVALAKKAHVITPNLTEAALLLGREYTSMPQDVAGLETIVAELSLDGKRSVVLTGVSAQEGQTGALSFDAKTGALSLCQAPQVARILHGTGDVFASVLTGGLVQGNSLLDVTTQAVEFVSLCAQRTHRQNLSPQAGVDFEPLLRHLLPEIN